MAYGNGTMCPKCGSSDTKPAESGGRICKKCGEWYG